MNKILQSGGYYPCFSCGRYNVPLTYFPGSENLLCAKCARHFYPTKESLQVDLDTHATAVKAGIL